jgi:hypothetical protein
MISASRKLNSMAKMICKELADTNKLWHILRGLQTKSDRNTEEIHVENSV